MMFLDFWSDPLGTILGWLGDLVGNILNILWLLLCSFVYPAVSGIMAIFTEISKLSWANYNDLDIGGIINRITLMLTIVMTFYIVFEFVKYTVSPDAISDKEKGAIPLFGRIIISILLLAFVPTIFGFANELQYRVLNTNVIGKVILGVNNGNRDIAGMGREFVGDMFSAFIIVDCTDPNSSQCQSSKQAAQGVINQIKTTNLLGGTELIQLDPNIQVNGLLALIFGCFILYVMFLYCKDIALRHIQLLFLQIISPIAIISYISPKKDGMFQKWTKQCLTTYLDVFIRMAVLYFMILICNVLSKNLGIHDMTSVAGGKTNNIIVYLFLITGLMLFVKKVPKLLQEFFPSSGAASIGYGFSGKDRKVGVLAPAKKAVASTAGAIAGGIRTANAIKNGKLLSDVAKNKKGKIGRLRKLGTYANVMGRSVSEGFKAGKDGKIGDAVKTGQEKVQFYENLVAGGGTILGHDFGAGRYQDLKASLDVKAAILDDRIKGKDNIKTTRNETKVIKSTSSYKSDWDQRAIGDANSRAAAVKMIEKATDVYATTNRDSAAQADYSKSIREAVTSVYGLENIIRTDDGRYQKIIGTASNGKPIVTYYNATEEEKAIYNERESVISNLTSQITADSAEIWEQHKDSITEYKRISIGQGYDVSTVPATSTSPYAGQIVYQTEDGQKFIETDTPGEVIYVDSTTNDIIYDANGQIKVEKYEGIKIPSFNNTVDESMSLTAFAKEASSVADAAGLEKTALRNNKEFRKIDKNSEGKK